MALIIITFVEPLDPLLFPLEDTLPFVEIGFVCCTMLSEPCFLTCFKISFLVVAPWRLMLCFETCFRKSATVTTDEELDICIYGTQKYDAVDDKITTYQIRDIFFEILFEILVEYFLKYFVNYSGNTL